MKLRPSAACLALFALCAPREASAQCRKRVLVYLDQSGSMDPQRRKLDSFYGRVFDAVENLLRSPGFLGPEDRVWVLPFGDGISNTAAEAGVSDWPARLAPVRKPRALQHTDLVAVFAHVSEQLAPTARFDQQIAIVASDFQHAPAASARGRPWREGFDRLRVGLGQVVDATPPGAATEQTGPPGNALVLVLAPGTMGRPDAAEVVETLRGLGARTIAASGSEGIADMAQALRRSMARTPRIASVDLDSAQRHPSGRQRLLRVLAENPGCVDTRIERLAVTCDGKTVSEPPLADAQRALAPRGAPGAQARLDVALPDEDCAAGFGVALTTVEGQETAGTPTRVQVEIQPQRQELAAQFFAPTLFVVAGQARGYLGGAQVARFEISDPSGAVLVSGAMPQMPRLHPQELRPARFEVTLARADAARVRAARQVAFSVRAPGDDSPRPPAQSAVDDPHTAAAFTLLRVFVWAGVAALVAIWFHGRKTPGWVSAESVIDWGERLRSVIGMLGGLIVSVSDKIGLLDFLDVPYSAAWRPMMPLFCAALIGPFCAYRALGLWHEARVHAQARQEQMPADILQRVKRPAWHVAVVGAMVLLPIGYGVWATLDARRASVGADAMLVELHPSPVEEVEAR